MRRVLCLGNNSEDTDTKTRLLATQAGLPCYGLLSQLDGELSTDRFSKYGYYHTSVYDIEFGKLIEFANKFDLVVMLDQPKDQWTHPDAFYNTVRAMNSLSTAALFQNPKFNKDINYWEKLVSDNKSFCIFPFIELLAYEQHSTVCCRSSTPVAQIDSITDFKTDPCYQPIRQKMLRGERLEAHCSSCYRLEDIGITSARQQETIEWANRLGLKSIQDLESIDKPAYYEIRCSNKCNLQCRMCGPKSSHLIDEEYRKIGIIDPKSPPTTSYEKGFEIIEFDNLKKLYIAGGEPLIMPELYEFLDECIRTKNVDFEILINTNGTKLSERFKSQITNFSNLQFIFSIDGYYDLNHYIRWPSQWETIVKNWKYLRENNHKVTINTTASIYNISRLHELFEFVDEEFPNTLAHIQAVEGPAQLSPFLYPNRDRAIESLEKIKNTQCYRNDPLFASCIDGYITKFLSIKHPPKLDDFFRFNDKLDLSRNIKLVDYLPELESFRPGCG